MTTPASESRAAPTTAATETPVELTLLALAAGGVSSLLIVTASAGWFDMPVLFWAIGLPGMLLVFAIGIYARSPDTRDWPTGSRWAWSAASRSPPPWTLSATPGSRWDICRIRPPCSAR